MEMRGEKVDVNTIRQNVKDKAKEFGSEVKTAAQNIGNKAKEFANTKGKAFASEVSDTARRGGRGLGHAIGVLFKVFFLFIAGTIAFAIFVSIIALIFGGIAWWPINNFLWTSNSQQVYAWGTLIFFLFIPLIAFITWLIRRIIRVRSRTSYLGWTFASLWAIGWVSVVLFATSVSKDFREQENVSTPIRTSQPVNGKMIVLASEPELYYTGRFSWMNDESNGWDLTEDTLRLSTIKFTIRKSQDEQYYITLRKHSFGRTEDEAIERAEKIQYSIYSRDSILDLASGYAIDKASKFRGQQVEVEIQVPAGKMIRFDKSIREKLHPSNFRVNRRYRKNRVVEIEFDDRYSFRYRTDVDYVMQNDGTLKDISGNTINADDYRYNGNQDSIELRKTIEQKERELKELKEEQKKIKTSTGSIKIEKDEIDGAISKSPSLIFSHLRSYL
jgi:hypothetical protein